MTVRDFLEMFNDLCGVELHIYDFTTEKQVWTSAAIKTCDPVFAVSNAGFDDYEMESCDLSRNNFGQMFLDINIATDEED